MSGAVRTLTIAGADMARHLRDLAELRIAVFAEFPYLYHGDLAYEQEYLREFAAAPGSALVVAFDGRRVVGAATASPMMAQKEDFRAPFELRGYNTQTMYYFGESVLLAEYRGQGLGHAFFDGREAAARAAGATHATFAAVVRADDHWARPDDYRPLDGFWRRRGYVKVPGLTTQFSWRELGERVESPKTMQYWMGSLAA
ncbi:GNAT family acetyltransferase [Altererythrobacter sp. B11]|uniref:GNAT family N-acetyltransferase n=1 Tax=Altererythrobacter sp. B11 TaxID=2060312 RepID=UPI000DC703EC|nr:GNAT family N-acetyltransferase [Altererythrobacter sp. B11]BBC73872.1 GNAT family acetyltransferase [Altererythrobacter sp. B11]